MSFGFEVPRLATAEGNKIRIRVKGTVNANVDLDVWFADQAGSLKSTTADEDGNFSVELLIVPPPPGEHKVFVKDKGTPGGQAGKTVDKAVMFPIPVSTQR